MTKVEDLMTEKVISVNPETKLGDAVAILTKNNFNGISVVDKQNTLIGLSQDLLLLTWRISYGPVRLLDF